MILCSCTGITDKDVWAAVESGIADLDGLRQRLGVADACGGCSQQISDLLEAIQQHIDQVPLAG